MASKPAFMAYALALTGLANVLRALKDEDGARFGPRWGILYWTASIVSKSRVLTLVLVQSASISAPYSALEFDRFGRVHGVGSRIAFMGQFGNPLQHGATFQTLLVYENPRSSPG